jgi:competence protein ComEC
MAENMSIYKDGKRNPNGYYKSKKKQKQIRTTVIVVLFLVFSLLMSFLDSKGIFTWSDLYNAGGVVDGPVNPNSEFSVYYLDVGQGDCTIIKSNDAVMMIDTSTDSRENDIKEAMTSLNLTTIDYLVITHQHDDHMGSANAILNEYNVKNILMPKLSKINMVTTSSYNKLLETILEKDVNAIAASPGMTFKLGDADVSIFSPSQQDEDLNNMSIVLKVVYGETSFLFQGDAEKIVEEQLLESGFNLEADVIKLGHHGSNTSSTDKYLKAVNPQYAIISCGADNSYGHPHSQVIDRLKNNNIDFYITAQTGDITIISDGKKLSLETQNKEWINFYE